MKTAQGSSRQLLVQLAYRSKKSVLTRPLLQLTCDRGEHRF